MQRLKKGDRVAVAPMRGCGRCASCLAGRPAWCRAFMLQGGGYAEYATATERQCRVLPKSVSLEDGALVEPLAVSLHGVNLSGLEPGRASSCWAQGPIGLAVTFWARRQGRAKSSCAISRRRRARSLTTVGASAFIPASEEMAAVNDALGGPADIVFECVGKPGIIAQAIEHCAPARHGRRARALHAARHIRALPRGGERSCAFRPRRSSRRPTSRRCCKRSTPAPPSRMRSSPAPCRSPTCPQPSKRSATAPRNAR